jgi:chorismate mutase
MSGKQERKKQKNCWQMNRELAVAAGMAISAIDMAYAQTAMDRLRPLVATSARRLAIAERVALTKWDSRVEVEDAAREAQVVHSAVHYGASKGLDKRLIAKVFTAQSRPTKSCNIRYWQTGIATEERRRTSQSI